MTCEYLQRCNQQMAFSCYHLMSLKTECLTQVQVNALQQATCLALGLALRAYLNELAVSLLGRQAKKVERLNELFLLCRQHRSVAAEVVELESLVESALSWPESIELQCDKLQACSVTVETGASALQVNVIASSRPTLPDLHLDVLESYWNALQELMTRQRANNIEY